ncbi:MAG: ABC transporter ATP-binding protein [bacterium]|nr:ABC transporter ATP-binding protein [bacterium]
MAVPGVGTIRILREAFRGYWPSIGLLAILGILGAALDGIGINAIIPLVSFLIGQTGLPTDGISQAMASVFGFFGIPFTFRYLVFFVGILFIGRSVTLAVFTYVRGRINAGYMAREIGELFRGVLFATWPFMSRQKAGYVQNSILWDAKRSTQLLDGITQFIQSSTGAAIYLAIAININAAVTLIMLVAGIIFLFIFRPLIQKTRIYANDTSAAEKSLAHLLGEHIGGFKSVKASGVASSVAKKGEQYVTRLHNAYWKTIFVQSLGGVFLQPISFIFVIGVFAYSYYTGSFNIAAFAATLYLIQKIFVYFISTQSSLHNIIQFVPFAENILRFKKDIAENKEHEDGQKSFSFKQGLEFKDVSLSYEGREHALSHISMQIKHGDMLALVGPSGGGKTSFADVLLRLFRPTSGEVLLDGVSADEIKLSEWRRSISYVAQDAFLTHDSIADNIRFHDDSISAKDIEKAARAAHIYDDIMALPDGFDTVLGDRGATLSGGQRQRVALARALARKPAILVLDEVTSSLDSELEREIQRVIDELRGSITLVVIAHRISTVVNADRMVVLEKGSVIEQGAPSKMLEDPTSYLSRMRALQRGDIL